MRPIMYVGVDPGVHGAIAVVHPDIKRSRSWDLPTKKVPAPGNKRTKGGKLRYRTLIDEVALLEILRRTAQEAEHAGCDLVGVVEAVAPQRHGGKGKASISEGPLGAFNFGASWGLVRGLLRSVCAYALVYPVSWRVRMLGAGASKSAAIRHASKLYPHIEFPRKKDEHRAEALLLATYGRDYLTPVYSADANNPLNPIDVRIVHTRITALVKKEDKPCLKRQKK